MKRIKKSLPLILIILIFSCIANANYKVLIDHTSTHISLIPDSALARAKSDLHIVYQHTSHGSQLITGMNALELYPAFNNKYEWSDSGSSGLDIDDYGIAGAVSDLSQGDYIDANGVTPWVTSTRTLLDDPANSHVNVIMWSWCSINGHNAQRYVDNMEILISEYSEGGNKVSPTRPSVNFVFMTGHAEGRGENNTSNSVHYNNELIRAHCNNNNRILFDFADIEAYNPGNPNISENPGYQYFWDQNMYDNLDYDNRTKNWATEWLTLYPTSELAKLTTGGSVSDYSGCSGCAHSSNPSSANLNCILKGRAAWWLWSRLAGWNSVYTTYYFDDDSDGYGDPDTTYESDQPLPGYVIDNTDCNDYDSNIHIGATEICGDEIDQDCNGLDKICVTQTQVAELYVATFNRAPDSAGLNYWVDCGLTIEQIAMSFFDQSETQSLYPAGNTDAQFVTSIYQNLFNRAPDAAGLSYWIGSLGLGGGVSRSVMIEALKNGATGTDRAIIDNKTEAGLYFANYGSQAGEFSLSDITDDPTTVEAAKNAMDDQ